MATSGTDGGQAEQLALAGLAPRRRRRRKPVEHHPASHNPIAQVVLDIQATHLGRAFDYLIDEKFSDAAQPGVMVRVRFGGQRVNGIIWNRVETSDTAHSALRYIERVLSQDVLVSESMRRDIALIAKAYGGTPANILRLAVPPRVARVDKEQHLATLGEGGFVGSTSRRVRVDEERLGAEFSRFEAQYDAATPLRDALSGTAFSPFVFDALPGPGAWADDLAWMAAQSLETGHSAVLVLPTMREVDDMAYALRRYGLKPFAPGGASHGGYSGDFALLSAYLAPAERYRSYLAAASAQVRCIIGTRAAMYAPVEGHALFAIVEDNAYQYADGMMPYAAARGVLRLRAKSHQGVFVALSNARSAVSAWEASAAASACETPVSGHSMAVHPLPAVVKDRAPWTRWFNRDELSRLADPTIGARVPHSAVTILAEALTRGPVLFSIPQDGVASVLSCAHCHRQARCARCTGPLRQVHGEAPRCAWCGTVAAAWSCPACKSTRMRVVRVGAAGTAGELRQLFHGANMVLSSPSQPRGVVSSIPDKPMIVIATPGAEPRVRSRKGAGFGAYQAVAILDAWTSLYAPGVDARLDALTAWMRAMALCAPRSEGGQALLLGETDPLIAKSLVMWDSRILADHELVERAETGLPPALAVATVWGRRDAVMETVRRIGAVDGDFSRVHVGNGGIRDDNGDDNEGDSQVPSLWGPVPIAQPRTVDTRELEATQDRVKVVVRVLSQHRGELADRLHTQVARHVANREPGELRFQLDPKDLI